MTYTLTRHAADVITRRAIQHEWIQRTLDAPERIEFDRRDPVLVHHVKRIVEFNNRALRVIFNPSSVPRSVVTVYFDRNVKDLS